MSASGADAASEVPHGRWSLQPSSSGDSEVARRIRHGAFITDADLFDNKCFSISPAESAAMDPQQRMLLEAGYEALHASSLGKVELMGSLTGVFVGIAAMDFGEVIKSTPYANSVYSATGSTLSVASGRISYALGLMGPCVSYDTACSAALAACHAALRAMQNDECADGLVAGASVMLLPGTAFAFATAGMTSARGRCHTFDSRADGYCRGEAICGMALRARTATTHYQLPLLGSCVRQDGKSASLTAPNGVAQQGLLEGALSDASTRAGEVKCIEAHGTGTALGDPIEVRSLATIVLAASEPHAPLALGSVKANSGHAEPAAGAAGLFRLAMGLSFDAAPPNAQLRSINPHVGSALLGCCARCRRRLGACHARRVLTRPSAASRRLGTRAPSRTPSWGWRASHGPLSSSHSWRCDTTAAVHLARGAAPARAGARASAEEDTFYSPPAGRCSRWSRTTSCRAASSSPARATSRWRARRASRSRAAPRAPRSRASSSCSRLCSTAT